ncbi:MAG: DUF3566 domain-containing protein [Actinomycetota bacterium]
MNPAAGVVLIAGGAAAGLLGAFVLWRRLPPVGAVGFVSGSGLATGAGALLVQENSGAGDWVITLAVLAVVGPLHCRVLFGAPDGALAGSLRGSGLLPKLAGPRRKTGYPMTQRMDKPGLATEPTAPAPAPDVGTVAGVPAGTATRPRRRARQTRVVIRKIGPWSVFKFSLLFYSCIVLVILLAVAMLYWILGAIGAIEHLTEFTRQLWPEEDFKIHGAWIFARMTLIGVAMVIIWSLINLFLAFLYNLISDVVGGIEVTLAEPH